jgi:plastocyanin
MLRLIAGLGLAICLMGSTGAPATRHEIRQLNKKFSQDEIVVSVGDSITFINDDDVVHNVFSSSAGLEFKLKLQRPGTAGTVAFVDAGNALVRCAFHPSMKLMVRVR